MSIRNSVVRNGGTSEVFMRALPGEKLSERIRGALKYIETDPTAQERIETALIEARDTGKINDLTPDVIAELLKREIIPNPYKFGLGSFVKHPDAQDWNDNGSRQEA